ncbi:DNA cytosine methyltransferase [Seonamhaeicola aphaedonensis]|uniref:Cytosine-specific methyltransferase n=1 Tax=Seonamhaeicola aphaedonensis TaxID=1461338 RepID=A0A3D9H408_9FLAO|nr:DNA (cytosine-5-)-methyltransferase [Seonamhaeicola aphaedonensis]RED44233.1 DNA (cytosine-5)-methyltransferase 1 [Seonamhaeicola aphaedonensis]
MLKYSKLRKDLNIENMNGNAEDLAFFTHYLHNHTNGVSKSFKKKAVEYYNQQHNDLSIASEPELQAMLPIKWDIPFPSPQNPEFTFIDLFAGIGGFRIPMQELGGKCVFSSEFNYHAQKAYELNFGEVPFGDITKLDLNIVPKHNVLCAGFPCQPFSISGKMKGFEDTRGTLIYHVFKIIEKREPEVVLLENVKHLLYHDKKRTLATIIQHLEELGYKVSKKVLNASDFGVPQNRERIIIIGHKKKKFDFSKLKTKPKPVLKDFLDKENDFEFLDEPYTILEEMKTQDSGLIFAGYRNKTIRKAGVRPNTEHLSRVHKQPNRIYSTDGVHPALPSQESSGRFWIYHENKVRKLTIQECYKIMGFPKKFRLINNRSELYRQVGNSVAVPMIKEVANQIKEQLITSIKIKDAEYIS